MFDLLSSQVKLLTLLSNYSTQEFDAVSDNFKLTIKLLNQSPTELLDNRRIHGALLPQEGKCNDNLEHENIQGLRCEAVLLNKDYLIKKINTFCLSEAIIVRDNFSNCLEIILDQNLVILPAADMKKNNIEKTKIIERSNVSPIRLTEIKQRLAQAVQVSTDKQDAIKNRLNKLLDKPTATLSKISSQQA
ncbi:hypothetical protein CXF71_15995 [Colwellia sp. 12G3]|nr:hypothetical protein CXF71_15995 [Colwellia sp. 12G3]